MSVDTEYTPPKVWTWASPNGGTFANINRPTAGATFEKALPVGRHPLQLYSQGTPNGVKITMMLEDLLALGHDGAEYDAWMINISKGDESGAILLYLAEKFGALLPTDRVRRTEVLNWLFWQVGSTPYLGGGFGHFYAYAPVKIEYAIDRFTMEVKRQLDVLDRRLADREFIAGSDYSIADIAIFPWYGALVKGAAYDAVEFLSAGDYRNLQRWGDAISARPATQRGRRVGNYRVDLPGRIEERHEASDLDDVPASTTTAG
jgi:GST-like protein